MKFPKLVEAMSIAISKVDGKRIHKALGIFHVDSSLATVKSVDGFAHSLIFVDTFNRLSAVFISQTTTKSVKIIWILKKKWAG